MATPRETKINIELQYEYVAENCLRSWDCSDIFYFTAMLK